MKKIRNYLFTLFVLGIAVFALPAVSASADEVDNSDYFPFVIFASDTDESVQLNTEYGITVNGSICSNGSVEANGVWWANINGDIIEKNGYDPYDMPDLFEQLQDFFFPSNEFGLIVNSNYNISNVTNINFNYNVYVNGSTNIDANIAMDESFIANGNIVFSGDVVNKHNRVLCSETGDITLNSNNINVNCLIYAPNGSVVINAQNVNINGIIIAKEIIINCQVLNINYSSELGYIVEDQF